MKSCMCIVYLMSKCSCNQPRQAYFAVPGKSNEKRLVASFMIMNSNNVIMNNHSQRQLFEFSAASSYQSSKYVETEISSLYSIHLIPCCCWGKYLLALSSDGDFIEARNEKDKYQAGNNQVDTQAKEKHQGISVTKAPVLVIIQCIHKVIRRLHFFSLFIFPLINLYSIPHNDKAKTIF